MDTPSVIQAYFDADRRNEAEALVRSFTPDAIVLDERRTHIGRAAIEAWWREARSRYQPQTEVLETVPRPGGAMTRARVSGSFPGSPAILTFSFDLEGDQIARLEITA